MAKPKPRARIRRMPRVTKEKVETAIGIAVAQRALTRVWPPRCPTNPEHGQMLDYPVGLYCAHEDHSGRPKSSRRGFAEPSQRWWSYKVFES